MMRPGSFESTLGFGEPELDANTALTELDKGLRSSKLGDQVEAIVRFPVLFERYPFPILINSAFLKLADVFRTGSNFLRLWVLRVCQQSERHLDKILNVDEFVRRIFSVMYANDPIARALTLRTLGSLSGLIAERKKVHHSIRVALDSNDTVEVAAAICAASKFAQKSKTFGTTMCTKIAFMVQRLSTPIDLKLKLIPIFRHMHHDVETASMVRKLCLDLLLNYPSEQFVTTILHTLTQLGAATITDLTQQVTFLLTYLEDSRPRVKASVLKDLKFLGEKGGHLWESGHISALIECMNNNERNDDDEGGNGMEVDLDQEDQKYQLEIGHGALDVIDSVTSSSAILPFVQKPGSVLSRLLEEKMKSSDMVTALKAIRITTDLAVNWKGPQLGQNQANLLSMASTGIESLLNSVCVQACQDMKHENMEKALFADMKKCLGCAVMLTKADNSKCEWLCGLLMGLFKLPGISSRSKSLIAQAIGSVGSLHIESAIQVLPDILGILNKMDAGTIDKENCTVATLIGIVFQAHQGHSLHPKTVSTIQSVMKSSSLWLAYRIGRHSLRYSQPETAALAFDTMKSKVASENFHYWLSALHNVSTAELVLSDTLGIPKLIPRIREASNLYLQGVSTIKAASSPTNSLQFQIEYLRLRSEMLVAFSNVLVFCNTLHLSPPAEVASNHANAMRDEFLKSGRVVTQLRKSIREFQSLGEMYGRLYQTAFDADNDTLLNVQILQQVCLLMARTVEKQVMPRDHPSSSTDDQSTSFFTDMTYPMSGNSWSLILPCKKAIQVLHSRNKNLTTQVKAEHIECIRQVVGIITETPLPFPRFFFQTLQMTRVKIAVSPQPRNIGEPVSVLAGNQLALKVEGVIQQSCSKSFTAQVFRKPKAIRLTVVTQPVPSPRIHIMDHVKMSQDPVTLVKDFTPHRDFFQGQFLLQVISGGLTNVTVDTSLVDFEGRVWMSGPRATLSVRGIDDLSSKQSTTISIPGPSITSSRPMSYGPGTGTTPVLGQLRY